MQSVSLDIRAALENPKPITRVEVLPGIPAGTLAVLTCPERRLHAPLATQIALAVASNSPQLNTLGLTLPGDQTVLYVALEVALAAIHQLIYEAGHTLTNEVAEKVVKNLSVDAPAAGYLDILDEHVLGQLCKKAQGKRLVIFDSARRLGCDPVNTHKFTDLEAIAISRQLEVLARSSGAAVLCIHSVETQKLEDIALTCRADWRRTLKKLSPSELKMNWVDKFSDDILCGENIVQNPFNAELLRKDAAMPIWYLEASGRYLQKIAFFKTIRRLPPYSPSKLFYMDE